MTALLLTSCAVEIKNERWYGDEGQAGAVWFETLTPAKGKVDKADWDALRLGMACTTVETLAEIKREIEQLCSQTNCNYVQVSAILGKFQTNLKEISP
jgi:hypothetical protein